jgi:hypothetical protein
VKLAVKSLRLCCVVLVCSFAMCHSPSGHAQSREEVVLWESIKDSKDAADFQGYLDKYPDGTFAAVAKRKIEEFHKGRHETIAGSTWDFRVDWIAHDDNYWHNYNAHYTPASPTSTEKNHRWYQGQFSFGEDGSCTITASGTGPCHWSMQGEIVTITFDQTKSLCAQTWMLTVTAESMSGPVNITGRRCDYGSQQASFTARP